MKVLVSWLREFASPEINNKDLAHTLTMSGLEVDGVDKIAPEFNSVVIGEVVECIKHPNADKLNLCKVNVGAEVLQIICGAKNVKAGLKVAVATVGAVLPGDFKIKKAKLREVESNGMICSESEIGLTEKSEGIMELNENAPIGMSIREYLNLDDEIIDIDITPNRGDCFSILGVAREVAVNYGLDISLPEKMQFLDNISSDKQIKTKVIAKDHCPKYLTRVITGIDNTKPTPKWMADKLSRSGFTTHSAIVDITNYVLLELGQPMHSFDMDKVSGNISVRLAKEGEAITLLNENTVKLNDNTLIIADDKNPLAIAGVMGGLDSSTTKTTTNIILESAFFDNILIAGRAREYGLHTESSLRFERGVDYNLPEVAINYATNLILDICGGSASEINSQINKDNLPQTKAISITYNKINQVLGFDLDKDWIIEKFTQLNFLIIGNDDNQITIQAPSYRFDINIAADLIEELARIYGYDRLPTKSLNLNTKLKPQSFTKYDITNKLLSSGYNEVINYSFISKDLAEIFGGKIELLNPISNDLVVMRESLIAGLIKTILHNKKFRQNSLKIFETGLCFNGENANEQVEKLAGLITGKTNYNYLDKDREFDFYDIKADIENIIPNLKLTISENQILQQGQRADIIFRGKNIGFIGAINPIISKKLGLNKCFVFEVNLSTILNKNTIKYQNFSNYQLSKRDISVLIEKNYPYEDIIKVINKSSVKYLVGIKLLDIWSDETMSKSEHSLTFSLSFRANDKTLIDDEIDSSVNNVLEILTTKFNATQR